VNKRTKIIPQEISDWARLAEECQYDAIKLATLCKQRFYVSRRTLERFLRARFQKSPQELLDEFRRQEAERLALLRMRTKEIAIRLGYKQESHFCRHFKEWHQVSVRVWRITVHT